MVSRTLGVCLNVGSWHNPDLRLAALEGPLTGAFRTLAPIMRGREHANKTRHDVKQKAEDVRVRKNHSGALRLNISDVGREQKNQPNWARWSQMPGRGRNDVNRGAIHFSAPLIPFGVSVRCGPP